MRAISFQPKARIAVFVALLAITSLIRLSRASDDSAWRVTQSIARPRVFLLDAGYLAETRQKIRSGDTNFAAALAALERDAKAALATKPLSVVQKSTTPPSGDKHDYLSQAPYFWPNPETSNGLPYIRRDGERNPEIIRISDHRNIGAMPET